MTDHDLDQRYRMADPGYHYDSEPEPYGPPYRLDGRNRRVPTHWHHWKEPPE